MADARFYDNRGPFSLVDICRNANIALPENADGDAIVRDVAGLQMAGPCDISFFSEPRAGQDFRSTKAGWCFTKLGKPQMAPNAVRLIPVAAPSRAFAIVAGLFYP